MVRPNQARRWLAPERTVRAAQRRRLRAENAELRSQRAKLDRLMAGTASA